MPPDAFDLRDALCTFQCHGMDAGTFLVNAWTGREAVSRPYRFDVTLACAELTVDVEHLLGRRATLATRTADGHLTPWHGVITHAAESSSADPTLSFFHVVLEPRIALLRHFRGSDVFLDKDLADILRTVLAQVGLQRERDDSGEGFDFDIRVPSSQLATTRQGFICQFEETSLEFLARQLEREGVYYWFEQRADGEAVIFADRLSAQPQTGATVTWRPEGELDAEHDGAPLIALQRSLASLPANVQWRDFAASHAERDLTVTVPVPREGDAASGHDFAFLGTQSRYGEHYDSHGTGAHLASVVAQSLAAQRDRITGESRATDLRAGHRLTVQGHPRSARNIAYFVIDAEHEGSQPLPGTGADDVASVGAYANRFTALPAHVQYRAPREAPRPRVIGTVSAVIDAEGSGQYAELDDAGRYKVRFPFAGSVYPPDHNSAWLRMATPYAGDGHGLHLPLLKGTEVLISFLDGNPDRPVIVAAVPNSEHPNMLSTATATQPGMRTAGGNVLAFEDRADAQQTLLASPVGQSRAVFGAGGDGGRAGIQLLTHEHLKFTSSSYEHTVPGIYQHRVVPLVGGGDGQNDDASPPTAAPNDGSTGSSPTDSNGSGNPGTTMLGATQNTSTNLLGASNDGLTTGQREDKKASPTTWADGFIPVTTTMGLNLFNYAGSTISTYGVHSSTITVGIKTDITVALAFGISINGGKVVTLSDKYVYDTTIYKKKVKEDTTAGLQNLTLITQNVKVGEMTEKLGTYEGTAVTSYTLTAPYMSFSAETSTLEITPLEVSMSTDGRLELFGRKVTQMGGWSVPETSVLGMSVEVGDLMTEKLQLSGDDISIAFTTAASFNGAGPVTINGALVRVG